MRELTYHKAGIFWRLASVYGPIYEYERETDICTYWKAVLKGAIVVVFIMAGAAVASILTGDMLAWFAAMLVHGIFISPTEIAALAAGILAAMTSIVAFAGLYYLRTETSLKNVHAPEFVREAYTSWKDKTCVKVKLQ